MKKHLIVVTGPTAVGKTALTIELAKQFNTVILSADSRQFFKEMTIGTAKPTEQELSAIPHYFINNLSITENYSVGDFERDALVLLDKLFETYDIVLMTGGSGLYIKAVCEGLDVIPTVAGNIREQLNEELSTKGLTFLQAELQASDPEYFKLVDKQNPQRVIRALEICRGTPHNFSYFRKKTRGNRNFTTVLLVLNRERNILYERINKRVDQMLTEGLLEEAKALLPLKEMNALQTVGYQELFAYLAGETTLERAVELIKRNTRRYAKRQLTWFRRLEGGEWFHPREKERILAYLLAEMKA